MTIRKQERGDRLRWVIDIPYRTADGRRLRFRRDAQIQTKSGAEAEHRRLIAELQRSGSLERCTAEPEPELVRYTFNDAVRHFRATHLRTALKP